MLIAIMREATTKTTQKYGKINDKRIKMIH